MRQRVISRTGEASVDQTLDPVRAGAMSRPLPSSVRLDLEPRFGFDFSKVRVFADARAAQLARSAGARAYTIGSDIVFGANAFAPERADGRKLLAHELAHTLQQRRGMGATEPLAVSEPHDATEHDADRIADAAVRGGALRLAHDASLRPAATEHVARQVEQPIVSKAPKSAMTIDRFIELVEQEEARYSLEEQQNTSLMITRLRKIFYDREGWNKHLVEGAANVPAPYKTTRRITGREKVDMFGPFDLTAVRDVYPVTDEQGKTPEISTNQEVRLSDGSFVDLGHVFAGLDAFNYPQEVGMRPVKIASNVGAVTWLGDLGSALAEAQFKYINKGEVRQAELQAVIDEYSSAQDMLGNIDAYVIKETFAIEKKAGGQKVSDILKSYYLGAATTTAGQAREHRYSKFARSVGLTGWNGAAFSNETAWVQTYGDEVSDAAALYIGATTEGVIGYPSAVGMSQNAGGKYLAQLFLDALKKRIYSEPAAPKP